MSRLEGFQGLGCMLMAVASATALGCEIDTRAVQKPGDVNNVVGNLDPASGAGGSTTPSGGESSVDPNLPLTGSQVAAGSLGATCQQDTDCDAGNCVDGVCCDSPCS